MFMTPPRAPDPNRVDPGPRSTSTWRRNSGSTKIRPLCSALKFWRALSSRTTTRSPPRPRMVGRTAVPRGPPEKLAPGMSRSSSTTDPGWRFSMSSRRTTLTASGVSMAVCSVRVAETVTASSRVVVGAGCVWAWATPAIKGRRIPAPKSGAPKCLGMSCSPRLIVFFVRDRQAGRFPGGNS